MECMTGEFVIQIHSGWGPTHFDLMLECGEALATWQLAASPAGLAPGGAMPARKLPDHRRDYLTYEGPVSGDRGAVRILDAGAYELLEDGGGRCEFRLAGRIVQGDFELRRCDRAEDWTLTRAGVR
jgi:hypothetical protein